MKKVLFLVGILLGLGTVGIATPVQAKDSGQAAMYRVYNPNSGEHFYR